MFWLCNKNTSEKNEENNNNNKPTNQPKEQNKTKTKTSKWWSVHCSLGLTLFKLWDFLLSYPKDPDQ